MELYVAARNNPAETFDRLTDKFINECFSDDEHVIIIALQILIGRLLKAQHEWPEDILGFADYVDEKYRMIATRTRNAKHEEAEAELNEFLHGEAEAQQSMQSSG